MGSTSDDQDADFMRMAVGLAAEHMRAKAGGQRRIPTERKLRAEAVKVFHEWKAMPDKTLY